MEMKVIYIFFELLLISFAYSQVSVCVCNSNSGTFTVKESCLNSCEGDCSIRTCEDYDFADSMNPAKLALLCSIDHKLLPISGKNLCKNPKSLYGCFNTEIDPTTEHPINVSCLLKEHDFILPCAQNPENLSCSSTPELKQSLGYKKSQKVYTYSIDDYFWDKSMINKYFLKLKSSKNRVTSIENLHLLSQLSEEIYTSNSNYVNKSLESTAQILSKKLNILGKIGYSSKLRAVVVVFRGTIFEDQHSNLNLNNLWTDIQVSRQDIENVCAGCKVHSGFNSVFENFKNNFETNLNHVLMRYPFKIIFTGHSLGGALATIASAYFASVHKNYSSLGLVTFGAPRVGNPELSAYINNKITDSNLRVTFGNDPVVCIPPITIFDYCHAGYEVHFKSSKTFTVSDDFGNPKCNANPFYFSHHKKYKLIGTETSLKLKKHRNSKIISTFTASFK